uniref:Uncharacterized protein n=1 Tax=Leersia perrieri TaxID=77586 RepID=A0A0D9X201_9ORYZ
MYRFLYPDRPDRNTIHFPHGDTAGNASFPASGRVSTFIFVAPTSSQPRTRSPTSNSSRAILTVAFGVSKMGPMEIGDDGVYLARKGAWFVLDYV